ncbi:MAG: hypothetical protein M5U28_01355 [Sandaracinaceae bacterium]|nr:hypothetical protein [Sandaracinaceae bacterium]
MRTLAFLAALTALATGCNTVRLADTVDLTFDWSPLPSDELHTPYVAGADFGLYTIGAGEDDTVGWTLESDDPSILRVDSTDDGDADVTAVGAGETAVRILDERGELVHAAPIDVRQADRAELFAHGGLILGRPELQEDWDDIYVLAGGSATFEVRWFEGDTRLFGHGALTASAEGEIVVEPRRTFLFEDREWVTFTPLAPGEYDVELLANGVPVRTVRVIAVTEDAIAQVQLHGMDESAARRGEPAHGARAGVRRRGSRRLRRGVRVGPRRRDAARRGRPLPLRVRARRAQHADRAPRGHGGPGRDPGRGRPRRLDEPARLLGGAGPRRGRAARAGAARGRPRRASPAPQRSVEGGRWARERRCPEPSARAAFRIPWHVASGAWARGEVPCRSRSAPRALSRRSRSSRSRRAQAATATRACRSPA